MARQSVDSGEGPSVGRGPRRVPETVVVRTWLEHERERSGRPRKLASSGDPAPVESLSDADALDELLRYKPGAAAFVWRERPTWHDLLLDRERFESLHVVEGPENLGWRKLSPDGTILGAARRVREGDPDAIEAETGVDVSKIRRITEYPPGQPLVLQTRRGCAPVTVADGNHRAVALACRLLDGEPYRPVAAYLGVCENPVLEPLRERVCGVWRWLTGRDWPP